MASESYLPEDLDDSINLESKVLLALARLQRKDSKKRKAVSCSNVVQFLRAHYSWLDGDIQSQVKTALLSFIKNGTVCILDNSKYRLLVPNSKIMSFACSTRVIHGPKCSCLFTLKHINCPNICCLVKKKGEIRKKMHVAATKKFKKRACRGRCMKSACRKSQKSRCVLSIKDSTRKRSGNLLSGCGDGQPEKAKKKCDACNSEGVSFDVPSNIFSPRDEVKQDK